MSYKLYAEEHGPDDASLILLLHGLGGGGSTWTPVVDLLSPNRQVLVPDLLGFGRSPWPDVAYTIYDHVLALEELLEDRRLTSKVLDVAGYSMGAILAAVFAARHCDRVRKLTLVSLPYFRSAGEALDQMASLGFLARLTATEHWAAQAVCGAMCALRPVLKLVAPHFAPYLPPEVARDALQHNFTSFSRSLRNVVIQHRTDAELTSLTDYPVHLVHGGEDRTAPLSNVRWLVERFPNWRLDVLPDAGHLLPVERPEEIARLLDDTLTTPVRRGPLPWERQ